MNRDRTGSSMGCVIGESVTIRGELHGGEDVVVDGRLEGTVKLEANHVTVGKSGRVKADIYGDSIEVEGEVRGNLHGTTQVVIQPSGHVKGNIFCPRVVLEKGCQFKGSIDMETETKEPARPVSSDKPHAPAPAEKPTEQKDSDSISAVTS